MTTDSFFFLALAAVGGVLQYLTTRRWEVETFHRLAEWSREREATPAPDAAP
jgi:hypothetical protein